jgi:hypothetical protein
MIFLMGKGYWEFINGDEKKLPFPKEPHITTNSNQQNLA